MKNRVRFFFLFLGLLGALAVHAQINELPRSTPEAEGVPSKAVTALFDSLMALPKTDIHSVVVVRHGKVIGEIYPAPFAPEYRHTMYSCSKTFVGAAVGLAIADNRLRLTDRVGAFFPELLPDSVSTNLADMTVRDLLTMTSGVTPDWNMRNLTPDWIRTFLAKPVKTPGDVYKRQRIIRLGDFCRVEIVPAKEKGVSMSNGKMCIRDRHDSTRGEEELIFHMEAGKQVFVSDCKD